MNSEANQSSDNPGDLSTLQKVSRVEPVGELKEKGISRVQLISRSQFETVIRDAVAREILNILDQVELSAEEQEVLTERAIARLSGEVPQIEAKPSESNSSNPSSEEVTPSPSTTSDFDPTAFKQKIIEEVGGLVSQNWREELKSAQVSQSNHIGRLEDRIDSLMNALDQIEKLMEKSDSTPADETHSTQSNGTSNGTLGGMKNELLEQLFDANLVLRELEAGEDLDGE